MLNDDIKSDQLSESKRGKRIKCEICEHELELDQSILTIGDIIECPTCGGTLEVVEIDDNDIKLVSVFKSK